MSEKVAICSVTGKPCKCKKGSRAACKAVPTELKHLVHYSEEEDDDFTVCGLEHTELDNDKGECFTSIRELIEYPIESYEKMCPVCAKHEDVAMATLAGVGHHGQN